MTLRALNLDEHWWEDTVSGVFKGLNLQLWNAIREQKLPGINDKRVLVVWAQQHFEQIKASVSTELKLKLQKIIPERNFIIILP